MSLTLEKVVETVQSFLSQRKNVSDKPVSTDTLLLQEGFLDSFALIELMHYLETELSLSLPDGFLIPEDFESPRVLYNRLLEL